MPLPGVSDPVGWSRAWEFVFVTSSQVTPMLLASKSSLENRCSAHFFIFFNLLGGALMEGSLTHRSGEPPTWTSHTPAPRPAADKNLFFVLRKGGFETSLSKYRWSWVGRRSKWLSDIINLTVLIFILALELRADSCENWHRIYAPLNSSPWHNAGTRWAFSKLPLDEIISYRWSAHYVPNVALTWTCRTRCGHSGGQKRWLGGSEGFGWLGGCQRVISWEFGGCKRWAFFTSQSC